MIMDGPEEWMSDDGEPEDVEADLISPEESDVGVSVYVTLHR